MLWVWRSGTVRFSQVLRLIPCEMCKWAPEDSAPVPRWNCHFLPFSDAFWMEYVMGMEKRNCRFCGTFCVKCGSGQGNIPVRFHDGAVIFSNSPMHFEQNSLMGMEKRNCRILTVSRRIPCERCKWAAEYSGGLRLCGGSSKSHDLLCCICGKEGRLWREGQSAFPISFCLHRLRKEGAMGILLDEPKYPVIDRAPSAGTTISNFNLADWLRVTAITSASIPVGYLAGAITSCVSVSPPVFWSL
jgi:hypothetical protein